MLDDRYWTKVNIAGPDDCWTWTANRNNKGYGLFRPGGTAPKRLAHRLSFADANGPIPKGAIILHSCDNPACVNPAHLRAGTHKQNVADMDTRNRRRLNGLRGETVGTSTATEAQVIGARRSYVSGAEIADICAEFGITLASLHDYVSGRSWRHLLNADGAPSLDELAKERLRRQRSSAKITKSDAQEIRRRLASGETGASLAQEYGLHPATISDIKRRKIWA